MSKNYFFLALASLFLATSCSESSSGTDTLFRLKSSRETNISFNNEMKEDLTTNLLSFAPIYNGAGVATADFNNDGLEDIFFGGNFVSSKLYINKGNLEFEDITSSAGVETEVWCNGISVVDINEDGFRDIYISVSGLASPNRKNLLFVNNGDMTFTEKASEYGLDFDGYATHSLFFDYDLDGDLDMYLLVYGNNEGTDLKLVNKKILDGSSLSNDKLYRNEGNGTFTDVTLEAGIVVEGYGLGIGVNDLNEDGYPDLYISNDFLFDDIVYINNQDGTFTDRAKEFLGHTSQFGMGVDFQDFNNDLKPDVVQLDMMPEDNYRQKKILGPMNFDFFNLSIKEGYTPQYMHNSLQLNRGASGFSEIAQLSGVNETDWSWSPLFADYDADGLKDLIITNGFRRNVTDWDFRNYINEQLQIARGEGQDPNVRALEIVKNTNDEKLPNYAYKNNGDLSFSKKTEDWGLAAPTWSNGMVYSDLDNDGDLDLVISNIDDEAHIYENTLNEKSDNGLLAIELKGEKSNPDGIGATIIYNSEEKQQIHYQSVARGYLSSITPKIYFAKKPNMPSTVKVIWPNGKAQVQKITEQTSITFNQENATIQEDRTNIEKQNSPNSTLDVDITLTQNDYVDFYYEPLLPHRLSAEPLALAKGDVNGDGLEDLYVGGSAGFDGYMLVQNKRGAFDKRVLKDATPYEDTDAIFFDADSDGDMDLFVASGSNEFELADERYQDRLYLNNGKGIFSLSNNLPEMLSSSSTVVATDIDNDGDQDLFIGGRGIPKSYPLPGASYLLENINGRFTDVTSTWSDSLANVGMVTDAKWADLDNNGTKELILAGEFMPITVFENVAGTLGEATEKFGLDQHKGWWRKISLHDINQDGLIDILAGNEGLNTKYDVSETEPIEIFAKDFDSNGRLDPIMSCYIEGERHMLHSKSTLETQVINFKRRYVKHEDFAKANFDKILLPGLRMNAYTRSANTFANMFFLNSSTGFEGKELPIIAQVSPIYSINEHEGVYYLSGNDFSTEVVVGQYDAGRGVALKFENNKWHVVNSDYVIKGEVKNSVVVESLGKKMIIHGVLNEKLKTYSFD